MQNLRLSVMRDVDLPDVAALNHAASPAVSDIGEDAIRQLRDMSEICLLARNAHGTAIAFLMSLGPGQPYDSENYQWFETRGVPHQYIDRIVVATSAKGTGVGRALYESVIEHARQSGASEVTCEVNISPPNPGSLAFHERMGFQRLAEQDTKNGTIRVALMARGL